MKKILCPYHNDTVPSMQIYGEFSHCYVCRAHVLTSELDLPESYVTKQIKREPTNVARMIENINKLPNKTIRGIKLPHDEYGYYVVWPSGTYYKRRNYTGKARYTAPAGVTPPLFVYPGAAKHLIVVEGEINAISLHNVVYGDFKICSPGPASDFMRHIKYFTQFNRITIFCDHDAPGVVFGIQLKNHLLSLGKRVNLNSMVTDFNQLLIDGGEEAVKQRFTEGITS